MQAQTQLKSTQAQAVNAGILRGQLEHAIAVLLGKPPAGFSIAPASLNQTLPDIPVGLPSTLLERRPDIAGAERRVAAANAQVGVAWASFFPDLTLTGSYGGQSTSLGTLLDASSRVWSYGGTGVLTVFDAGAHSAQVREAHALYDAQVATYRLTVLTAMQQVEDQLTSIALLKHQAEFEDAAVAAAREAERITQNEYRAGTVDYTTVVTAQTAALTNEQSALTVRNNQFVASVTLIQAIGGGWTVANLDKSPVVHNCIGCSSAHAAAEKAATVSTAEKP
jgi:NodT family efflux transporter outer membrane factor (OMF) lipoprotein